MENNKLTTEEDFQFFKSEALRFMELFGIKDWEVFFTHENEYPDDRAWVLFKANAHIARISLNKDWSRQDLIDQIKPELLSRARLPRSLPPVFLPYRDPGRKQIPAGGRHLF